MIYYYLSLTIFRYVSILLGVGFFKISDVHYSLFPKQI